MAGHQADQLFARFQRSRDPDLLAQVFDLTAAKLLRVAIHLSQDPAAAEDLVQATFVTAMEKVDQYHCDRPVLPWLSGILELHAKTSRSKSRRRIEPTRLGDPLEEDPERRAQENELGEAVDAALDRIPETYRTVSPAQAASRHEPGPDRRRPRSLSRGSAGADPPRTRDAAQIATREHRLLRDLRLHPHPGARRHAP